MIAVAQKANSLVHTKWLCKYRHRTEVKLVAAIAEKHPKVRFAVSCTSAYADLYDHMEQALRKRVANAVEVVRSDISPALLVHTGPNLVGVAIQGL